MREYPPKKPAAGGPALSSCVFVALNPSWWTIEAEKNARPKTMVPTMNSMMITRMT